MNAFCTRFHLAALVLAALCTTGSAVAQTSHKTTPVKKSTVSRPASTAQRPKVAAAPTTRPTVKPAESQEVPAQAAPAPVEQKPTQPVVARNTETRPTAATTRRATPSVSSRQKYLNVGVGLAAYYGGGLPLGASFEVETKNKNVSVGGSVDYLRYGYNSGGYKWNYTFVYVGGRVSYHLGEALNVGSDTFDPYIGATLGFRYAGYNDTYGYDNYSNPYNSGLYVGIHLGSRFMFSEKLGGFAEVGYGVSALKLGLTAKF
ncbi:hypothetical protein [Spirosoma areae]